MFLQDGTAKPSFHLPAASNDLYIRTSFEGPLGNCSSKGSLSFKEAVHFFKEVLVISDYGVKQHKTRFIRISYVNWLAFLTILQYIVVLVRILKTYLRHVEKKPEPLRHSAKKVYCHFNAPFRMNTRNFIHLDPEFA